MSYSLTILDNRITTASGDIVDQIPSLVGYATESWVSTNYIDTTEILGYVTDAELVTTSGDIVAQIPSLSGYAAESWVSTNYIDNTEMTTISGDLVAQMGEGGITQQQLTTTSGDIVDQIPSSTRDITVTIDGGGAEIADDVTVWTQINYACTISAWTLLADQSGSITLDIWIDSYANYPPTVADTITASAKPTITTATKNTDSTLSGWTTSISEGDIIKINVDSCTTIERVALILKVTET